MWPSLFTLIFWTIESSAAIQHVRLQAASLTTSLTANSAMAQLQGCRHDRHVFFSIMPF